MKKPSPPRNLKSPTVAEPEPLDRIDRKILNRLQRNSAMPNQDLAAEVGLSTAPTSRRVKRLKEDGYITREVALVDPARVGSTLVAFVGVELDRQREDVLRSFERHIANQPEVQQCYFVSGETDYLLVVVVRDMDHYNSFVRSVLANEHNIKRFRSSFNLQRIKFDTGIYLEE
ncbi:Lrp/AsnC family transcriptional regulator [Phreatobacter aquaticus]|uniref:Lrp/AsnC family transcriptional regulator n=1 Tax=Phreatobacter aquaticus TaxID=2570229 RepID=A0A4D7QMS2_9HYPH|nr:Lrp/AsnC family transcriptional regulator [Phreatobacter aquaticus]QCK86377.1 Lrp/AsnC family transcriptional regulator [Phreatobacter aquaticus]